MRMDAYYYGFDHTGHDPIDLILSAVACAGKAYHNTEDWMEKADPADYNGKLRGESMVQGIQNAAFDASNYILQLEARLAEEVKDRDHWRALAESLDFPKPE